MSDIDDEDTLPEVRNTVQGQPRPGSLTPSDMSDIDDEDTLPEVRNTV